MQDASYPTQNCEAALGNDYWIVTRVHNALSEAEQKFSTYATY